MTKPNIPVAETFGTGINMKYIHIAAHIEMLQAHSEKLSRTLNPYIRRYSLS